MADDPGQKKNVAGEHAALVAPRPNHDRVGRKETYDKPWARLEVGVVEVAAGETTLRVRAKTIAAQSVMELKAVEVERVER